MEGLQSRTRGIVVHIEWTLRPFMGDPTLPFILFSQKGGNIYSDVMITLGQLFSGW
jgi:hypothetical protein